MLDEDELRGILEFGGEQRSVEFKSAGSTTSKEYVAKVARAAIALSNYRGGGYVILGIDDVDPLSGENGLNPDQLAEWTDVDLVGAKLNTYSEPALDLVIRSIQHPSGKPVVVLRVAEFREYPTMCKRNYGEVLFEGQLFTRSAAKPESAYRQTHGEIREVIELSVEKNLSRFLERAQRGGLTFSQDGRTILPADYSTQLESAVVRNGDRVHGAHFQFSIRPRSFDANRIEIRDLQAELARSEVRHWGWSFPALDHHGRGQDWIAGGSPAGIPGEEAWSFYQSGLFVSSVAISKAGKDPRLQLPPGLSEPNFIAVHEPIVQFSLLLEFATRQMASFTALENEQVEAENQPGEGVPPSPDELIVTIEAHGIRGAALAAADPQRSPGGFWNLYTYSDDVLRLDDIVLRQGTSIADSRLMALSTSANFFHHFGWQDATPELLSDTQMRVMDE